jgi:hypothetical protein
MTHLAVGITAPMGWRFLSIMPTSLSSSAN